VVQKLCVAKNCLPPGSIYRKFTVFKEFLFERKHQTRTYELVATLGTLLGQPILRLQLGQQIESLAVARQPGGHLHSRVVVELGLLQQLQQLPHLRLPPPLEAVVFALAL